VNAANPPVAARPHVLPSETARVPTALGAAFVTLTRDPHGQPFEVFLSVGKAGTDTFASAEALGRLISLALRLDSPVSRDERLREIATQLAHIGATRSSASQPSLPDALSGALFEFLHEPAPAEPASGFIDSPVQVEKPAGRPDPTLDLPTLHVKGDRKKRPMNTKTVTVPPTILAAAETLAAALIRVEPIAAYRRAQAQLEATPHARALLERLSAAQADLRARSGQSRGTLTQSDLNNVRALQQEVRSDPVIMDYAVTQQAAVAYLPKVNQEISQLLGTDFAALAGPASC